MYNIFYLIYEFGFIIGIQLKWKLFMRKNGVKEFISIALSNKKNKHIPKAYLPSTLDMWRALNGGSYEFRQIVKQTLSEKHSFKIRSANTYGVVIQMKHESPPKNNK